MNSVILKTGRGSFKKTFLGLAVKSGLPGKRAIIYFSLISGGKVGRDSAWLEKLLQMRGWETQDSLRN